MEALHASSHASSCERIPPPCHPPGCGAPSPPALPANTNWKLTRVLGKSVSPAVRIGVMRMSCWSGRTKACEGVRKPAPGPVENGRERSPAAGEPQE